MIVRNGKEYDFWIPPSRKELVKWLRKHYPRDKYNNSIKWGILKKPQLLAIYINYRIKLEDDYENQKEKEKIGTQKEKESTQYEFDF